MSDSFFSELDRLPLGMLAFSNIRKSNMIYVDKTALIAMLARERVPLFFSRPRRFGKTLLVNTLKSLFSKGVEEFRGLAIENQWHDTCYTVVHFDFSTMADSDTQNFKRDLVETIIQQFSASNVSKYDALGIRNPNIVLSEILQTFNDKSIVLLVDEYDAPLTHHLNTPKELDDITSILNNFYATIKQYTDKFRFIFITGITRTSHISIFSAFNNLVDLSLKKEFNSILGFTQEDIETFFDSYIRNSSRVLKMTECDIYQRLKQYYDGFQFSLNADETVYNPWSVLCFFKYPEDGFKNYWFKSSGSSSIIMKYMKSNSLLNSFNYRQSDYCISEDQLSNRYDITNIPSDVLLFQSGYLSIRKKTSRAATLVFPNAEVEDSILQLFLLSNNIDPDVENYCNINDLIDNIDKKNLLYIVNTFNEILNECISCDSNIFSDERSVRDIIYTALPEVISLQKIKERMTVKGRSDLEILTRKTHMVIEFKRTYPSRGAAASLLEAIDQIQKNRYGIGSFQSHKLYRVAMVISTEDKAILYDYCSEVI